MSVSGTTLQNKAAELRRMFDNSFAAPSQPPWVAPEHMLAIVAGSERFAVRVREISGLVSNKNRILRVPSRIPELAGITGIRGTVVPVFSLAALLGLPPVAGRPKWLILCGGRSAPVALAFEEMERHFESSESAVQISETGLVRRYVKEAVRVGVDLRGLIDVAALVEYTKRGGGPTIRPTQVKNQPSDTSNSKP